MSVIGAHAVGIANIALDGSVLDTWFPAPELVENPTFETHTERLGAQDLPPRLLSLVRLDDDRMVEQVAVHTYIRDLQEEAIDAHDVYLRLHLLSHRLVKPNCLNMVDAVAKLSVVVWTNKGPCLPDNFEHMRTSLRTRGLIHVYGIDPLPRMVDYVVPTGVQISEAERVRLGAYLAEGTMVIREGYVSHNAGTLGPCRVEGRIASGTTVGQHCSLQLSSALISEKPQPLQIGDNCSIGIASTVHGVNLGDNVIIGNTVTIAPTTPLYFADSGTVDVAGTIDGQSHWSITLEAGSILPVARKIAQ